jgi:hypothetical protein
LIFCVDSGLQHPLSPFVEHHEDFFTASAAGMLVLRVHPAVWVRADDENIPRWVPWSADRDL